MHTSQTTTNTSATLRFITSSRLQQQRRMLTHFFPPKPHISPYNAARALIKSPPATHLLTVHTFQTTSSTSVTPHLSTSSRRQQRGHMLTHVFFSETYVSSHIFASAPLNGQPATHLLIVHTSQAAMNTSVTRHLTTSHAHAYSYFLLQTRAAPLTTAATPL